MTGISAQGSKLEVATGSGGVKTITGIAPGNPTIFTCAGHGFTNGTAVTLASIVGTIADQLNGETHIVANVTANTFALLDEDTTGKTYTSGGTATPATYTQINGFKSFDGFDGSASDIDVTDLGSVAMEYISGLVDNGKFGFEVKRIATDNGQLALSAARVSGAVMGFRLTLPDTKVASFSALVKSFPISGAVNSVMTTKVDTKITGAVTWA
jgi:hypothetical protein